MRPHHLPAPERILTLLAGALLLKVTFAIVSNYRNYFPPDFASDFLRGREGHFRGAYWCAFHAHILSGPVALVLGSILIGGRFRARFPAWHRRLGRLQVAIVLGLVTPGGLVMASHAAAGPVAAVGLATLAIATATCVSLGARAAMARRFASHRRWMWRGYLLLSSAIVLRLMGGLATVAGVDVPWFDPLATWMSWLLPLAAFELHERVRRKSGAFGSGLRPITTP